MILGSLRNYNGNAVTRAAKKVIGLDGKTITVHHAFLYSSLPSLPDYMNVKCPIFTFSGDMNTRQQVTCL